MTDLLIPKKFANLVYWLRKASGFDPESLGWEVFAQIISQRMKICLVDDLGSYTHLLEHSSTERSALIEATVIPESWFFRDPSAFHTLKQITVTWRSANNPWRILSMPCASGEEPYSIVITLLEIGLMPNQFHLDAADISATAISKAIQGIYTENSFRSATLEFRDRYFVTIPRGYQLINIVRDYVDYSIANLFTIECIVPYDIIFCRNLLIYFDQETRAQAFRCLHTMLTQDGWLVLGGAEAAQATDHGWVKTIYQNVFRKASIGSMIETPRRIV